MILAIPYPPTGNHATKHAGGRHYTTEAVKRYRMEVATLAMAQDAAKTLTGPLKVLVEVYPPDNRRRDLDNVFKSAGDAITKAGVWQDDYQICDLRLVRMDTRPGGQLVVHISEQK
jgi:crossover junction endodeoxyribonuclease RusA